MTPVFFLLFSNILVVWLLTSNRQGLSLHSVMFYRYCVSNHYLLTAAVIILSCCGPIRDRHSLTFDANNIVFYVSGSPLYGGLFFIERSVNIFDKLHSTYYILIPYKVATLFHIHVHHIVRIISWNYFLARVDEMSTQSDSKRYYAFSFLKLSRKIFTDTEVSPQVCFIQIHRMNMIR